MIQHPSCDGQVRMPLYTVECVDRESGISTYKAFEARDESAAVEIASQFGFVVGRVFALDQPQRSRIAPAATAAIAVDKRRVSTPNSLASSSRGDTTSDGFGSPPTPASATQQGHAAPAVVEVLSDGAADPTRESRLDNLPGEVSATEYVGFLSRGAALFVDGFCLFGLLLAVSFAIGLLVGASGGELDDQGADVLSRLIFFVCWYFYFSAFESSKFQATPGKMFCEMRVTDLQGNRLTFGRAAGRTAAKLLSDLILFLGWFFPLFTARKQALHDLVAGTVVVRARKRKKQA